MSYLGIKPTWCTKCLTEDSRHLFAQWHSLTQRDMYFCETCKQLFTNFGPFERFVDPLCLAGSHDFGCGDYDPTTGWYNHDMRTRDEQLQARCERCGITLLESVKYLLVECERRLTRRVI